MPGSCTSVDGGGGAGKSWPVPTVGAAARLRRIGRLGPPPAGAASDIRRAPNNYSSCSRRGACPGLSTPAMALASTARRHCGWHHWASPHPFSTPILSAPHSPHRILFIKIPWHNRKSCIVIKIDVSLRSTSTRYLYKDPKVVTINSKWSNLPVQGPIRVTCRGCRAANGRA